MAYTLDVNINSGDPSGLNRIADALGAIASRNKLAAAEVKFFNDEIDRARRTGENFAGVLKTIEKSLPATTNIGRAARELREHAESLNAATKEHQEHSKAIRGTIDEYGRLRQVLVGHALSQSGAGRSFASPLGGLIPGGATGLGIAAGAAGAGFIINQIREITNETATYGREIQNLSIKTGLTVQESQLFTRAAQLTGVSVSNLVMQVRQLSRALSENGDEGRRAKRGLAELGLDSSIGFQAPGKALEQVYGRLEGISNPLDRARISANIFGRAGLNELPLAQDFRRNMQESRSAAELFSDADIRKAAEYKRQTELLGIQYDTLKRQIGISLLPAVQSVVQFLRDHLPGGDDATPHFTDGYISRYGASDREFFQRYSPGLLGAPENVKDPLAIFRSQQSKAASSLIASMEGNSPEGRKMRAETALKDAQENLVDVKDTERAAPDYLKRVAAAERIVLARRQEVDALRSRAQIEKELFALEQEAEKKRFQGPFGAIAARRAVEFRNIAEAPGLPAKEREAFTARAGISFGREITGQAQEEFKHRGIEAAKADEHDREEGQKLEAREFQRQLHEQIQTGESVQRTAIGGERERINMESNRTTRLAELREAPGSGFAGQARAINEGYQERLNLAQKHYETTLREITQAKDFEKEVEMFAKAADELKTEQRRAEIEHELKLAELQKHRLESERQFSGGLFDAIKQNKVGDFIKQGLEGQARIVFQNVTQPVIHRIGDDLRKVIPGQRDPVTGELTPRGKILQGTVLAQDPAISAAQRNILSTDHNTVSEDKNTAALDRLTAALSKGGGTTQAGARSSSAGIGGALSGIAGLFKHGSSGGGEDIGGGDSTVGLSNIGGLWDRTGGGGGSSDITQGLTFGDSGTESDIAAGAIPGGDAGGGIAGGMGGALGTIGGIVGGISDLTKPGTANKVAGGLEIAAAVDPEPFSKAALMVAAMVAHMFGKGPQQREEDIKKRMEGNQFYTPVGENISESTSGTFSDMGRGGFARNSPFSPFPNLEEPYYDFQNHVMVQGRTVSQFGGTGMPAINQTGTVPGPGAPPVNIHIHNVDANSLLNLFKQNPHVMDEAIVSTLQTHNRFVSELRPQI
jgi:hypothetical protein